MTRQRTSLACVALLLMAIHRQQPHLAAGPGRSRRSALPAHLADTGLFDSAAPRRGSRPTGRSRRSIRSGPTGPRSAGGSTSRRARPSTRATRAAGSSPWAPGSGRSSALPAGASRPASCGKRQPAAGSPAATCGTRMGPMRCSRDDGVAGAIEIVPGRQHNIPSRADCAACHGTTRAPLGFNPLQLSNDRDPNAIHGEPLTPEMITLQTLVDEGLLTGPRGRGAGSASDRPPAIRRRAPCSATCRQLRRLPQRRRPDLGPRAFVRLRGPHGRRRRYRTHE